MDLEVSTWTRRERLERIASAERDRRAGRKGLAVATLGDGQEWSARVVLALIHLPEEEGSDARSILEATLDDWAAESGLEALSAVNPAEAVVVADTSDVSPPAEAAAMLELMEAAGNTSPFSDISDISDAADVLAEPIAFDELERAFAEAEAQTDEMHDVNTVAARVLMDEPLGLAELSGDAFEAIDGDLGVADAGVVALEDESIYPVAEWETDAASVPLSHESQALHRSHSASSAPAAPSEGISATDVAWMAAATVWPTSYDVDPTEPDDIASAADYAEDLSDQVIERGRPSLAIVIGTLERWLTNLETTKTGRAQRDL